MKKTEKSEKIEWHKLLGKLLKDLLSPVDIDVFTEPPVMSESPQVDILLLRRNAPQWTPAQLALLPDGVRDTTATDILLEFKYTQSLNENAIQQALTYDFLYKENQSKEREEVQSFLLSARQPQKSTLKKLGYKSTNIPGVYRSRFLLIRKIVLLSLNELANEPHNAFIKCFASHRQEKEKAFDLLEQRGLLKPLPNPLRWFITGLKGFWFTLKGDDMDIEMTAEQIADLGKRWGNAYLSSLPISELLEHYDRQTIFAQFKPQEILSLFDPQERLVGLKPQEIFSQFAPQEILTGLKPQQLDELQEYFKKREQKKEN
jgi:hypothetical protein